MDSFPTPHLTTPGVTSGRRARWATRVACIRRDPRDLSGLLVAIAEAAATLTGLLFVAISIRKRADTSATPGVVQEYGAAEPLALTVPGGLSSRAGARDQCRVPGGRRREPSVIFFTAAGMRSILASTKDYRLLWRQGELVLLLFLTFGFELGSGIALITNGHSRGALDDDSQQRLGGIAAHWGGEGMGTGRRQAEAGSSPPVGILSGHGGPPAAGRGPSAVGTARLRRTSRRCRDSPDPSPTAIDARLLAIAVS